MRRLIVRCDGTAEGGLGHLVRSISVAQAARDAGWSVEIAGDITDEFGRALVRDAAIDVIPSAAELGALVAARHVQIVHVDSYAVTSRVLTEVHASGALLSSMEDSEFGRRAADVVIDSTLGAEDPGSSSMTRPDDGSPLILRGIDYAPMRREVRAARELRGAQTSAAVDSEKAALVVMGGTDATGAAGMIAALCAAADGVSRVTVIAPKPQHDALRQHAGCEVEVLEPTPAFLELAAQADFVVSASGTTSWELACIGVPTLLVAVADNQLSGYRAALRRGMARGLGAFADVRADSSAATATIAGAVQDLRAGRSWAERGKAVVDGRGAERIVTAWERILTS